MLADKDHAIPHIHLIFLNPAPPLFIPFTGFVPGLPSVGLKRYPAFCACASPGATLPRSRVQTSPVYLSPAQLLYNGSARFAIQRICYLNVAI